MMLKKKIYKWSLIPTAVGSPTFLQFLNSLILSVLALQVSYFSRNSFGWTSRFDVIHVFSEVTEQSGGAVVSSVPSPFACSPRVWMGIFYMMSQMFSCMLDCRAVVKAKLTLDIWPPIHPSMFCPIWSPGIHWARDTIHPGQAQGQQKETKKLFYSHVETYKRFRDFNQPNLLVFGLWRENRGPRGGEHANSAPAHWHCAAQWTVDNSQSFVFSPRLFL